ncbi:MAG: hypothetical protein ABSF60_09195 [Verrucomicrobiota bacterium]
MRTKTLLIASAALAAGILTSSAQTYSQNIVGYVVEPLPAGYSIAANPLNGAVNNSLQNTFNNGDGSFDGNLLLVWTGSKYATYTFDSTMPQGFADANDINSVPAPVLNPGTGFLINNNQGGGTFTNTWTGTVAISSLPGTTTNTIPAGLSFYASQLPYAGGVETVLNVPSDGSLDGNLLEIPNINGSGAIKGYNTYTFDSTMPQGFGDANDLHSVPEPVIPVGGGFFINNNQGGGTFQWVQTLNP